MFHSFSIKHFPLQGSSKHSETVMNSYDGRVYSCKLPDDLIMHTHTHVHRQPSECSVCVRERARDDLCGVMASGVGLWLGQLAALMRWRVLIAQR